jgi:hypothetical protein
LLPTFAVARQKRDDDDLGSLPYADALPYLVYQRGGPSGYGILRLEVRVTGDSIALSLEISQ